MAGTSTVQPVKSAWWEPRIECAVFYLRPEGIEPIGVADGVDVQRDVVERIRFKPIVREGKRMAIE
jgi:hypothetical protein